MAEESFIILENTPSLMENYSFLEMPDSVSLCSDLQSQARSSSVTVNNTNDLNKNSEIEIMKSIWSTKPLTVSTTDAVFTPASELKSTVSGQLSDASKPIPIVSDASVSTNNTTTIVSQTQTDSNIISLESKASQTVYNENHYSSNISDQIVKNTREVESMLKEQLPLATTPKDVCSLNSQPQDKINNLVGINSQTHSKDSSIESEMKTTPLSTTPRDKLAESFLLGNIDYNTMTVCTFLFYSMRMSLAIIRQLFKLI